MTYMASTLRIIISTNSTDQIVCNKSLTAIESAMYNLTIMNYLVTRGSEDNDKYHDTGGHSRVMTGNEIHCMSNSSKSNYDYLLPFYVMLVLLCLSAALFYAILMMYRHRLLQKMGSRLFMYQVDSFEDLGDPRRASTVVTEDECDGLSTKLPGSLSRKRIKTVDTLRGISVILMVFVNYGGGNYRFMAHSPWNGLTVADLVFPWFTFVMGITVALTMFRFSLKKMKKYQWLKFWLLSAKRTLTLFIIGVGLENPNSDLSTLRIMGPLQRLSVAYFCLVSSVCVVTFISELCKCRSMASDIDSELLLPSNEINMMEKKPMFYKCREILPDIVKSLPYIIISCALLVAHACISLLLVVDNCPRGYLGPGGMGDNGCCGNCTGGVAGYIDRIILTDNHMYENGTMVSLFHPSQPFDPEGILGNLTCTALCFMGYWAGNVMLLNREWVSIIKRLFIYALICAAIGTGLCEGKLNGGLIPINKNLWSVSYVLVTTGTSFFLLSVLFVLIDVFKIWSGAPFKYPGMNPIVIYVGHELLQTTFPIQWNLHLKYNHSYHLMMNVWGCVFWTGVGYVMYIKKLFITV